MVSQMPYPNIIQLLTASVAPHPHDIRQITVDWWSDPFDPISTPRRTETGSSRTNTGYIATSLFVYRRNDKKRNDTWISDIVVVWTMTLETPRRRVSSDPEFFVAVSTDDAPDADGTTLGRTVIPVHWWYAGP